MDSSEILGECRYCAAPIYKSHLPGAGKHVKIFVTTCPHCNTVLVVQMPIQAQVMTVDEFNREES